MAQASGLSSEYTLPLYVGSEEDWRQVASDALASLAKHLSAIEPAPCQPLQMTLTVEFSWATSGRPERGSHLLLVQT